MDTLTIAQRSERMSRIRSTNTKPEVLVRKLLHRMGHRFRIHRKDLPGKPDIVMPSRRQVIFVHGCFWHAHSRCSVANVPKTKTEFWVDKFSKNKLRDKKNRRALRNAGWKVLVIWECETKGLDNLERRLQEALV